MNMSRFIKVIETPFSINPDGLRVLQCHSRGDRRFSPFCCFVEAFAHKDSIENHYQRAKVFDGNVIPSNWREAKRLKKSGVKQVGWQIGSLRLPCLSNDQEVDFALHDFGIQFYIALWHKYLRSNQALIRISSQFDEFEDPFRGTFPFCQADVIRQCVREGIDSLRPMYDELYLLLKQRPHGAGEESIN